MDTLRPPTRPVGLTATALLVALGVLVALASRGQPLWTLVRDGPFDRTVILLELVGLWVVGLLLAAAVAGVAHRALRGRRRGAPPFRATATRAAPFAVVALSALSLLTIARTDVGRHVPAEGRPAGAREPADRRGTPLGITGWWSGLVVLAGQDADDTDERVNGIAERNPAASWLPVGAGALAITALVAAVWWWRRRRLPAASTLDPDASSAARREAHGAVVSTIDAMLADPDPHTAIIGAYARLLEELDARGTGRLEHEAPGEHIRRVLTVLRVRPEPLRELIGLFTGARFSTHTLTAAHRDRALDALRAVAGDLTDDPSGDDHLDARRGDAGLVDGRAAGGVP